MSEVEGHSGVGDLIRYSVWLRTPFDKGSNRCACI